MRKPGVGRQRGFSLIEILVVVVIICLMTLILVPRLLGRRSSDPKKPAPSTPIQRAHAAAGSEYIGQINQAIQMYRGDHNEENPPDLESLKSYGVLPQMVRDQNTGDLLPYNPTTGVVGNSNGPDSLGGGNNLPQIGQ